MSRELALTIGIVVWATFATASAIHYRAALDEAAALIVAKERAYERCVTNLGSGIRELEDQKRDLERTLRGALAR